MTRRITLVSCSKDKLETPAPARELYGVSPTFVSARFIAERGDWRILSAKHGVVHPMTRVAPYDFTLIGLDQDSIEQWGTRIAASLEEITVPGDVLVLLASRVYGTWWVTRLRQLGRVVETPLYGLSVGRIKGWLRTAGR